MSLFMIKNSLETADECAPIDCLSMVDWRNISRDQFVEKLSQRFTNAYWVDRLQPLHRFDINVGEGVLPSTSATRLDVEFKQMLEQHLSTFLRHRLYADVSWYDFQGNWYDLDSRITNYFQNSIDRVKSFSERAWPYLCYITSCGLSPADVMSIIYFEERGFVSVIMQSGILLLPLMEGAFYKPTMRNRWPKYDLVYKVENPDFDDEPDIYYCEWCETWSQSRHRECSITDLSCIAPLYENRFFILSEMDDQFVDEIEWHFQRELQSKHGLQPRVRRTPEGHVRVPRCNIKVYRKYYVTRKPSEFVCRKYKQLMHCFKVSRRRLEYRHDPTDSNAFRYAIATAQYYQAMEMSVGSSTGTDDGRAILEEDEEPLQHEMDTQDAPHQDNPQEKSYSQGTSHIHGQEVEQRTVLPRNEPSHLFVNREDVDLSNIAGRWFNYTTFEWNSTQTVDKQLTWFNVPSRLINTNDNTPVRLLWNYSYVKMDVELLFQVSTTEFHCGCLIASMQYGSDESTSQYHSKNVYSALHRPHIKLFAGAGCEGVLDIPFRYPYSFMHMTNVPDFDSLNYGYIMVRVLNPLKHGSSSVARVSVNVSFRLSNIQVAGIRSTNWTPGSADDVNHEMEEASSLVSSGKGLLQLLSALDKPRASTSKQGFVPQLMQNPSVSADCKEVTNILSVSDSQVVPHMEDVNECDIEKIIRMWGFVTTFKWNVSKPDAAVLKQFTVSPLMKSTYYTQIDAPTTTTLGAYSIPPVGFISAVGGYYRGSLEFKFDVVCTKFHAGRLLVGYVPGLIKKNFVPNMQDLTSISYVVYDIAKEKQFVYRVPYITPQLMYPRRNSLLISTAKDIVPVGYLVVAVYTRLAINDATITDEIEVNVYMRGGEDFRLYIPAQPSLIPKPYNSVFKTADNTVECKSGYYPWYVGKWHYSSSIPWLRYGPGSDHIAQYYKLRKGGIYQFVETGRTPLITWTSKNSGSSRTYTEYLKFLVALKDNNGPYYYMIAIPSNYISITKAVLKDAYKTNDYWGNFAASVGAMDIIFKNYKLEFEEVENYCTGNPPAKLAWDISQPELTDSFELLDHEMDERYDVQCPVTGPMSLAKELGSLHIGEGSLTLLNLLRRFQLYASVDIKPVDSSLFSANIELPIRLEGFPDDAQYFWRSIKQNVIAYISSAYWFFKGSLRFKVIVLEPGVTFWVQHKYDTRTEEHAVREINGSESTLDMFNHGYAYIMQNSSVNPCIEFETPYYSSSDVVVSDTRPQSVTTPFQFQYYSMGSLLIGANKACNVVVLYAFGDSARLSNLIGPPPMSFLEDMPLEHQVGETTGVISGICNIISNSCGMVKNVMQAPTNLSKVAQSIEEVKPMVDSSMGMFNEMMQSFSEAFQTYVKEPVYDAFKQLAVLLCSNLSHLYLSPTMKNLTVTMMAFFSSVGIFTNEIISSLISLIERMFKRFFCSTPQQPDSSTEIKHESGTDEVISSIAEYGPAFVAIIFTAFGVFSDMFKMRHIADIAPLLVCDLPKNCRNGGFIFFFFKNVWKVVMEVAMRCVSYFIPSVDVANFIESKHRSIVEWAVEVERLCKPEAWIEIKSQPMLVERVKVAKNFGSVLMSKLLLIKQESMDMALYTRCKLFYDKINALDQKCFSHSLNCRTTSEPFVLWICGPSGIGKSNIKDYVMRKLIDSAHIDFVGELYYTVQPQVEFWNGCAQQPCLYYDDFMIINNDDVVKSVVGSFNALKSAATFNPNMASLGEKDQVYKPHLIYVNSNMPFPQVKGMAHPEAFYRRRDMLIYVDIQPQYKKYFQNNKFCYKEFKAQEPNADELIKTNAHLCFSRYKYPENEKKANDFIPYDDFRSFMKDAIQEFNEFREEQVLLDLKRLKYSTKDSKVSSLYSLTERCKNLRDGFFEGVDPMDLISDDVKLNEFLELNHEIGSDRKSYFTYEELFVDYEEDLPYMKSSHRETKDDCPHVNTPAYSHIGFLHKRGEEIVFVRPGTVSDGFGLTRVYHVSDIHACAYADCNFKDPFIKMEMLKSWYMSMNPTQRMLAISPFEEIPMANSKFSDSLARFIQSLKKGCNILLDSLCYGLKWVFKHGKYVALLLAIASGIAYGLRSPKIESELMYSGDQKILRACKKIVTPLPKKLQHETTLVDAYNNIADCVKRNTVFLVATSSTTDAFSVTARCFVVEGHKLLGMRHYHEQFDHLYQKDPNMLFRLVSLHPNIFARVINYKDIKYNDFDNSSLGIFTIPKNIPSFRSYVNLFTNQTKYLSMHTEVALVMVGLEGTNIVTNVFPMNCTVSKRVVPAHKMMSEVRLDQCYEYGIHGSGMCGSLLVSKQGIIGVHVAGGNSKGFSEPVYKEMFVETACIKNVVIPQFEQRIEQLEPLEGVIIPIGYVAKQYAHHESGKTSLQKSLMYEVLKPSQFEPSVLSQYDSRLTDPFDPLKEGCSYHCIPTLDPDLDILERVERHMIRQFRAKCKPVRTSVGVLDIHDSVMGYPGLQGYDRLKMDTSEGYPFIASRPHGFSNKSWLFSFSDDNQQLLSIHPMLTSIMALKQDMRIQGIRPFTLFTDCLKDTKVKKKDVLKPGKTRVFSISPVDFTLHVRQYFLDFAAAYMSSRLDLGSAIGIDIHSHEWQVLYERLLGNSSNIVAADYSKFGPRLNAIFLNAAFNIILSWYEFHGAKDQDTVVRRVLAEEMIFSYHLMYDFVYQVVSGAPSGNPLTVILNDIVNHLYLQYAWLVLNPMNDLDDFDANVVLYTYGDDLIMSVADDYIDVYNTVTLQQHFARYDIKFTDDSKSDSCIPFKDIVNCSFLKCSFIPHSTRVGRIIACLEDEAAYEICNWIRKSSSALDDSIVNAEACLHAICPRGEVEYTRCKHMLEDAFARLGHIARFKDYHYLDNHYYGSVD